MFNTTDDDDKSKQLHCALTTDDLEENLLHAYHAFHLDTMQLFSIIMANLNSILNPIIYAFWYPDFRKTLTLQIRHLFK